MNISFMHHTVAGSFAIFQENDTCVFYDESQGKAKTTISAESVSTAPDGWFFLSSEATELSIVQSLIEDGAMEVQPEPLDGLLVARLIPANARAAELEA